MAQEKAITNVRYIENTMLVSFDIRFIMRDQKRRRNGGACRASPTCFWSGLINLISKDLFLFIMHHHHQMLRRKESQTHENQTQFCSNLLTSRMLYDGTRRRHLTNVAITVNVNI